MSRLSRYFLDEISVRTAAQMLGLSVRTVERLCWSGAFRSAYKPGDGVRAHWRLSRCELMTKLPEPEIVNNYE